MVYAQAHKGTYHKMSPKHLQRYVTEFTGRHNARGLDAIEQMAGAVKGMEGKRLTHRQLIANNGLDSYSRPCRGR